MCHSVPVLTTPQPSQLRNTSTRSSTWTAGTLGDPSSSLAKFKSTIKLWTAACFHLWWFWSFLLLFPCCFVPFLRFKATLWLSETHPLSLAEQVTPIIDLMAISNAHFAKLRDFITLRLPPGFPVKIGEWEPQICRQMSADLNHCCFCCCW